MILQRERIERELRTLVQIWSMGMRTFEDGLLPGEDIDAVLDVVQGLIQKRGVAQFPKFRILLARIDEGLRDLDQMRRNPLRQQEEQFQALSERIQYDLSTLMQILTEGLLSADERVSIQVEVRTLLALARERIREDNMEARAQLNSVEEELGILAKIEARLIREVLEGRRERSQDVGELRVQMDRVKRNLMILIQLLARPPQEARLGDDFEEGILAVLDLIKDRIAGQREELRAQFRLVGEKLQATRRIMGREGDIRQQQEQRKEVEKQLIILIQMIGEQMGFDGQIERERRIIMDLVRQELSRQIDPITEQLERVEMQLKPDNRGIRGQQRDRLDRELRSLMTMIMTREGTNPRLVRVKISKNVSDGLFERERLERMMQTLEQLKIRLAEAKGDERQEVEQQIDEQRDQIERELRTIINARDIQRDLRDNQETLQAKIAPEAPRQAGI